MSFTRFSQLAAPILLASQFGHAQTSSHSPVRYSAFFDTYYAVDSNSPNSGDRAFTTQPARDNEFNINLAYIDATLEREKTRGRIALQAGTSVQSNYSSEANRGSVSGPTLSRHIQEARLGYRLGTNTWIDAGIFFAHVGSESFVPRDNLTLTRSLVADYSPYYLAGVKLTHSFSSQLTALLLVTNGWQNISENNTDKNLGTGLEFVADHISVSYNTMIGTEISPPLSGVDRGNTFRHFHNLILKSRNLEHWELIAQVDLGFQSRRDATGESQWSGGTFMARYSLNPQQRIPVRMEYYRDPDQVIAATGQNAGLSVVGGSIGFDQQLDEQLFWRNEIRHLISSKDVFSKNANSVSSTNTTLTTSIALGF